MKKAALKLINLKVDSKDRKAIEAAAKKYTGGNVSEWLRLAGIQYKPKRYVLR